MGDPEVDVTEAVAALRRGEVIGLPTETVYGLAGDASNPDAVRRIFELKQRPADHPLIVHLADQATLGAWAVDIPRAARDLADRYWPGPLTLILKRSRRALDLVTGGQDTVGIRVPAHPIARAVLGAFGGGLAIPSANRFGHVSPTCADHVREEFGDALGIVLDGGDCTVGIESTIVDLSGEVPRVLRPGQIGQGEIEHVIGRKLDNDTTGAPRASGTLAGHYAPRTPLVLTPRAALGARMSAAKARGERVVLMTLTDMPTWASGLVLPADPVNYARLLYGALRELDREGADRILVERPPGSPAWDAVLDRLRRAATGSNDRDEP